MLWDWLAKYRAWKANRKVFIYPENSLEPESQDNETAAVKKPE